MGYLSGVQAPRMRVIPAALAAVSLAAALASAGCGSSSPATDGPLSSGVDGMIPRGENCVTRFVSELQTFGDQQFTNQGHATVVLDRVVLLHPHNERLIGSYAVPGAVLIGVVPWPPKYRGMPPAWKDRQPVHGFRLAPGKTFNMVLGVTAAGPGRATSQGMLVYYHDSAGSYVSPNYFAMIIVATKSGCD
jgi:hypothetical protein